ncbi:hypothetical protein POM88_020243 [Heracleum sosnowskyi]|uniref:GDSL esterase/lipase n=1 Tax=Heracleum sosnowskyi TaxID=360622 RepID=A0AAD8IC69_9APIA|nr:hypothetical protein POM88_020243 [Heracleum sosnowskyi]
MVPGTSVSDDPAYNNFNQDGSPLWCIGFQKTQDEAVRKLGVLLGIRWADYDCKSSVNVSITSSKDEFFNGGQLHSSSSLRNTQLHLVRLSGRGFFFTFLYMRKLPSMKSCRYLTFIKSNSNVLLVVYCPILWCGMIMGREALIKLLKNVTVPGLILFGDSIADQVNNNNRSSIIKCSFPPYGIDFSGGLATGRFTNA